MDKASGCNLILKCASCRILAIPSGLVNKKLYLHFKLRINSLLNDKFLDKTILKAFADDKSDSAKIIISLLQGLHSLEKYFKAKGSLEKSLKTKLALKSA